LGLGRDGEKFHRSKETHFRREKVRLLGYFGLAANPVVVYRLL
jgi:hypothetical protein